MNTTTFMNRILGATETVDEYSPALTLRYAVPADAGALDRLAQLDSRHAPRGVVLVAEVGGGLWAAISVDDHDVIADPFRPTGELVELLVERARQLRRSGRRARQVLPRLWPDAGLDRAAMS